MNTIKILFILFLITIFGSSYGQNTEIYTIKFNFHHSRRIPDNYVSVNLERYGDSIHVSVKSIPMDTVSLKWKETKQEYSFGLALTEFEKVVSSVKMINCMDIANGLGFIGFDGTVCEIEIGGIGTSITFKVWSPDYETKERNLQPFLEACKLILVTGKLDPKKIL
jgi:hypothetical protein